MVLRGSRRSFHLSHPWPIGHFHPFSKSFQVGSRTNIKEDSMCSPHHTCVRGALYTWTLEMSSSIPLICRASVAMFWGNSVGNKCGLDAQKPMRFKVHSEKNVSTARYNRKTKHFSNIFATVSSMYLLRMFHHFSLLLSRLKDRNLLGKSGIIDWRFP